MSSSTSPNKIKARESVIPFWRDERVLTAAAQVISAIIFIGALIWVGVNLLEAAKQRGLSLGFDFINEPAGFPISESVIPFDDSYPFGTAFLVGLLNTLKISIIGIVLATVLGTIIGLARLSTNWLVNRIALAYIELHRNIPLLVLLFIWYFAIFNKHTGKSRTPGAPLPKPARLVPIMATTYGNRRLVCNFSPGWFDSGNHRLDLPEAPARAQRSFDILRRREYRNNPHVRYSGLGPIGMATALD